MRKIYQFGYFVGFVIFLIGCALVLMVKRFGDDDRTCQFCNEKFYSGHFFGCDWCCSMCWYEYDLDHVPLNFQVAEVKIEEIEDDVL